MPDSMLDTTQRSRVVHAVAVSTTAQLVARGFDLIVNVAASLLILRYLGPTQYGDFVVVVSIVGLAGLLAEFGLPKLAVREVARDPGAGDELIGTVIWLRLGLCVVAALVAQLALAALDASATVRVAALIASGQFVGEAFMSVVVVFHVALKQQYEAFVRLVANIVKLGVVIALVTAQAGLVLLVAATTCNVLVAAVLAWIIAHRRFGLRPTWTGARAVPLMRAALPIGPAMMIGVLYLKLDALMDAALGSRGDVGVYGAAYQPIEYLFLASAIVVQVIFPLIARARQRDPLAFTRMYRRGTDLVLATVGPVAVLLAISARPLVHVAYSDAYRDSAVPMMVLSFGLVLMTMNVWQGLVLLAADRQGVNLAYLSAAVVLNIVLDIALVPRLGPAGAAWGTLLSAAFMAVCSTAAVAHFARATLAPSEIARVVAANAFLAGVVLGLRILGVQWVLAALIGALLYAPALALCRVFSAADLRAALRREPEVAADFAAGGVA
jgi:O-antigen/teichoic acid export membrane protein